MKVSQLLEVVTQLNGQLDKVRTEFNTKIEQLEVALADVEIPAEAQLAIDSLKAKIEEMDALNPDAVVEADPVEELPVEELPVEELPVEEVQPEAQEELPVEDQAQ